MMVIGRIRHTSRDFVEAWRLFWFSREPAYTLGLVRIGYGALAVFWTLELLPNLYDRFGVNGMVVPPAANRLKWNVFNWFTSDGAILSGWVILLLASIALMVGFQSRAAAIIVFVLIVSFERRNPFVFNSGDGLIHIEALFLAFAASGAALSIDQRRRAGSFWSAESCKVWPLRLMQIQLTIVYLCSVISKLGSRTWQDGTAVSYSVRVEDLQFLPVPTIPNFVSENLWFANLATWGTLVLEAAIGILVWNRRWRPRVLLAGVVLHVSIMVTINVGFFSLAMFVLYLAFIPTEQVQALSERGMRLLPVRRRSPPSDGSSAKQQPAPSASESMTTETALADNAAPPH